MPPFLNTQCVHCQKNNRFDIAEILKENGKTAKGVIYRGENKPVEEVVVTCQHCGRKFKVTVKGGK
jgi:RNase P subunit RPR2